MTKKSKQWKFEQNRTTRSRVMNFQSFSKSLLWGSLSWQLWQHLWCHSGQLCIHFVHRISHFLHFQEKLKFFWFVVRVWHGCINSASILGRIVLIPDLKCHINQFFWKFIHKMNGELSTMTSQMLAMLPTQGSPLQGFTETFRIHNSWTDCPISLKLSHFTLLVFLRPLEAVWCLGWVPL